MIKITTLRKIGKEELKDIEELMNQLSSDPSKRAGLKLKKAQEMVSDKNTVIAIAKDNKRIVGLALLNIVLDFDSSNGHIESVIVHSDYRGQGLGEKVCRELISIGKKRKLGKIELTSKPSRIAANKLYPKLGFELRETNPYRLKLRA